MKIKKSLGQNFLINLDVINKIAAEIPAFSHDLIIEIGPGRGALTEKLVKKDSFFLAYEIDQDLLPLLQKYENDHQKIIHQDFLQADVKNDLKNINYDKLFIVGNLPYYITTPIMEKIMALDIPASKIVIMVQKEVGLRFMAQPKSKDYGYFTLVLKYFFDIQKVCMVSKKDFYPVPKVESMVLAFTPRIDRPNWDFSKYRDFLKVCFRQKRKTLRNNLKDYDWSVIAPILKNNNYSETVRAEELDEKTIGEIFTKTFKD